MRAVLQRVSKASVQIDGEVKGAIGWGFLILLGIEAGDNQSDIDWLCRKIVGMRVFSDENDKMNRSINDIPNSGLLIISQFTLHASCKKGNRPSFINAAKSDIAIPLYHNFIDSIKRITHVKVATGEFGADMKVSLINDGPVTILLDSKVKE